MPCEFSGTTVDEFCTTMDQVIQVEHPALNFGVGAKFVVFLRSYLWGNVRVTDTFNP